MDLRNIGPAPGAIRRRRRMGRGTSAGQGRTCGKGHKGQKSRAGYKVRAYFEGGQMPIQRRLPKRGFSNYPFRRIFQVVNLKRVSDVFGSGGEVTPEMLLKSGLIKKSRIPVKLLGDGEVSVPFKIYVHAASQSAVEKIKVAGGEVHLL
ncbi:50S ribosomal protein L15 [candidate division LCP-89 bacterium B3_LCP]|uniref:Large ribosomal subunit protein uL15 n=1 Tax=candidate division LCP-89 bacterium B3_LCP TaxID=2012998 RepID=A0A532UZZ6_UNCL8|nr:MAG: 50S ribosomal protein L15 [candidate division LCP-89 bacterium B3_LCP]